MSDQEQIAKDQGTAANPWPHPRPDIMTETHGILLTQFYSEGLDTLGMISELAKCCDLRPSQARNIVLYWMISEGLRL